VCHVGVVVFQRRGDIELDTTAPAGLIDRRRFKQIDVIMQSCFRERDSLQTWLIDVTQLRIFIMIAAASLGRSEVAIFSVVSDSCPPGI
jgi:hypothetical protein